MMAPGPISRAPIPSRRLAKSPLGWPGTIWNVLPSMKTASLSAMPALLCACATAVPALAASSSAAARFADFEAMIIGASADARFGSGPRRAPVGFAACLLGRCRTQERPCDSASPKSQASICLRRRGFAREPVGVEHLARQFPVVMRAHRLLERMFGVLVLPLACLGASFRQPVTGNRLGELLGVEAVGRTDEIVEALLRLAV